MVTSAGCTVLSTTSKNKQAALHNQPSCFSDRLKRPLRLLTPTCTDLQPIRPAAPVISRHGRQGTSMNEAGSVQRTLEAKGPSLTWRVCDVREQDDAGHLEEHNTSTLLLDSSTHTTAGSETDRTTTRVFGRQQKSDREKQNMTKSVMMRL